jgi:hypothetical protein
MATLNNFLADLAVLRSRVAGSLPRLGLVAGRIDRVAGPPPTRGGRLFAVADLNLAVAFWSGAADLERRRAGHKGETRNSVTQLLLSGIFR